MSFFSLEATSFMLPHSIQHFDNCGSIISVPNKALTDKLIAIIHRRGACMWTVAQIQTYEGTQHRQSLWQLKPVDKRKRFVADNCMIGLNTKSASGVNPGNSANLTVLGNIQHAVPLKCALHRNAEVEHSNQLLCNYTVKNVWLSPLLCDGWTLCIMHLRLPATFILAGCQSLHAVTTGGVLEEEGDEFHWACLGQFSPLYRPLPPVLWPCEWLRSALAGWCWPALPAGCAPCFPSGHPK